ncbi:sirohydrochlorin chelatase [Aldersonia sp. NBC_00410]|uniref:sirohydrochlorin chelatase n=1 Tax=Aldersonia sp. NBC_00410 TaxID=2975954 RepID=UPI0022563F8F|nr:sirohydrochlorin chelatase [Aldersonia sp. NBC_00410]MCX5042732.1 sirohydrochlorin chelatase [Aldersonia sp. NBC_00410]
MSVPLIAVAHGSRDPRSARAIAAALGRLRARHPERDVRLAFLDLNAPSVGQAIDAVAGRSAARGATGETVGYGRVVVVPLLLGSAFHARVDLPAIIAEAQVRHPFLDVVTADILGADDELIAGARRAIAAAGVSLADPDVGVALCAVGSRRPEANAATRTIPGRVLHGTAWRHARTCFATAASPTVSDALRDLRAAGARSLVVVPWMLAPGVLLDRVHLTAQLLEPDVRLAATLTAHADLATVIDHRYRSALTDSVFARRVA